ALLIFSALRIVIAAQPISSSPIGRAIADQFAVAVFALPVAGATVWWLQIARTRLLGWLGSATTTVLFVIAARRAVATMDQAVFVLAVIAIASTAVLLNRADVWWRYVSERAE